MDAFRLISDRQRQFAKDAIDNAPHGWVVTVKEEKRRDAQNRLFWEIMGDLSRAEPEGRQYTKYTWRNAIMQAVGHTLQFERGLDGTGVFPIDGTSSSLLGVSQMALCIEYAFAYGAGHGVIFSIDRKREAAELFRLAA